MTLAGGWNSNQKNLLRYSIFLAPVPDKIYLLFIPFYEEIRNTFFYFCRLTFFEVPGKNLVLHTFKSTSLGFTAPC
jgi:hypothetical protein